MKKWLVLLEFLVISAVAFGQTAGTLSNSALSANRRTAIRYLQLAKQYASQKQWAQADANAQLGIAYDETIADLWYLRAVSRCNAGDAKKREVLPYVVRALTDAEWVDYNRDSARILYADLLSTMLRFDEAISVLDMQPFLYSADAEYIRAKCYYNLGGEYIARAREKIDAARRIYPTDVRFAELFFSYEYRLHQSLLQNAASGFMEESLPPLVRKIADAFILLVPSYKQPSAELELYAGIFAEGEKQTRLLKSFKARNLKTPLYAEYALRAGLLDQQGALDEFFSFADDTIDLAVLQAFVPLVTEDAAKQDLYEYLNAYGGCIVSDPDGDGFANVRVDYNRGRPATVTYDANQDDDDDWTATCDFGAPVSVQLHDEAVEVMYGSWPWIQSARYVMKNDTTLDFTLVAESVRWTPFVMQADKTVQEQLNLEFFFPHLQVQTAPMSALELLHASSSYVMPSAEKPNAQIRVSVLDGVAQLATYFADDVMYAQAHFENGIPTLRVVDADGDGLFETTEFYGFAPDRNQTVLSTADEMQIITNLFGAPSSGTGFYVRMIQIDTNGDTIPDFTEEYLAGEGKISSWDTSGNGNWDTRYIRMPKQADGILREESLFHQPLTHAEVRVRFENGTPVQVIEKNDPMPNGQQQADRVLTVFRTNIRHFYWIGERGSDESAQKIMQAINQTGTQGVSIIAGDKTVRMLGVRIGDKVFGEMLPESMVQDDEKVQTEN